jgi:hypothetical protein
MWKEPVVAEDVAQRVDHPRLVGVLVPAAQHLAEVDVLVARGAHADDGDVLWAGLVHLWRADSFVPDGPRQQRAAVDADCDRRFRPVLPEPHAGLEAGRGQQLLELLLRVVPEVEGVVLPGEDVLVRHAGQQRRHSAAQIAQHRQRVLHVLDHLEAHGGVRLRQVEDSTSPARNSMRSWA